MNVFEVAILDKYSDEDRLEAIERLISEYLINGITVRTVDNSGARFIVNHEVASSEIAKTVLQLIEAKGNTIERIESDDRHQSS